MKILLASDTYIYQTSGAANVVITLENGLRRHGHDVRVLAPANERTSFREGESFFIRSVPALFYPDVRLCPVHGDPLVEEIKRWKPDLIHLHTEASIARRTGAPIVITTHTDYADYLFGGFRKTLPVRLFMNAIGKPFYQSAAAVTAPSEKARDFAMMHSVRDKMRVIPNGIHLERFQKPVSAAEKAALFEKHGMKDNGFTLVMVTRVSHEKNILEILQYMPALRKKLPQAQLIIAGDGPDRKHLETYCEDNGLKERVCFAGRIPPDEVYRYYAMGNVFVSASTFEVHSLSYLEAMACGLPLVCREDACLLGVLENGKNGFIYRTEGEYVDAVARILTDRTLRESMCNESLNRVGDFSDEHHVENMIALYEEVLGTASRNGSELQFYI